MPPWLRRNDRRWSPARRATNSVTGLMRSDARRLHTAWRSGDRMPPISSVTVTALTDSGPAMQARASQPRAASTRAGRDQDVGVDEDHAVSRHIRDR